MYTETKKLHIIEEVLKIKSESVLADLEVFLKRSVNDENQVTQSGFDEFSGIWSKEEAEEIERIIEESCEIIYPDDWK